MEEVDSLKRLILQKLVRADIWGGKHIPFNFVKKGVPEHYRNSYKCKKIFEKAIKELINEGWVILTIKRTGKGSDAHISLNQKKVDEIRQYLGGAE